MRPRSLLVFVLATGVLLAGVLVARMFLDSGGSEVEGLESGRVAQGADPGSGPAVLVGSEDVEAEVPAPEPAREPESAPEPEPETAEPEEQAPESVPPVEIRIKVVDELGRPLPDAALTVRGPLEGGGSQKPGLDEFGERLLTLLPEDEQGRDRLIQVEASASGRSPVQRIVQWGDPLFYEGGELRLVLKPGASLDVVVTDAAGEPATSAIVVLVRTPDGRKDVVGATRLITDAEGRGRAEGLAEGDWSAQVVAWRDFRNADAVAFTLATGASERLELEVERWGRELYASGRVVGPGEAALTPEESDGIYLRRTDMHQQTSAVDADGAFFVKPVDAEPSTWELVREGEIVSDPFDLRQGSHDVVVVLQPR